MSAAFKKAVRSKLYDKLWRIVKRQTNDVAGAMDVLAVILCQGALTIGVPKKLVLSLVDATYDVAEADIIPSYTGRGGDA